MKKTLLLILALVAIVSCQTKDIVPEYMPADDDLCASIESINATKTVMDENNNVLWSEDDQLVAFMKTTLGVKYQIKEQYVGTSTGGFSKINEPDNGDDLEAGQELDHNVVVYPHSYDVWCMKNDKNTPAQSYKLNLVLPETQIYEENSFAIGAFPMVAVSEDNKLTFKNICGGLKLQLKGADKIKFIKLEGLGNEKISGKSTVVGYVDGSAPAITMAADDKSYSHVILDCGEGVQLSETTPTTFIIAVPPVEFASGMKITVTDTDGLSRTLTNSSSNKIKRSSLLTFPVITYQQEGVFEIPEGTLTTYEILAEGGTVEIPITTNQDYQVVIPEGVGEWISVVETKALRNETITLNIAENPTPEARSAEVLITTADGITLQAITISQEAGYDKQNRLIIYTSTDGETVSPKRNDGFGANIISNIYENGVGVITFDADVTGIGYSAFENCVTLKSIHIPASVTGLGTHAFKGCKGLQQFSGKFASDDGCCLLIGNGKVLHSYVGDSNKEYSVPDGITEIYVSAFYESNIESVILPSTCLNIGSNAFEKSSLKSIHFPKFMENIWAYAFSGCQNLESVVLPEGITYLEDGTFYECINLSSVTLPESLQYILGYPFENCDSLSEFYGKFSSEDHRYLYDNNVIISVAPHELTEFTVPEGFRQIRSRAFSCKDLVKATLPSTVKQIGEHAFYNTDKLSELYIYATEPPTCSTLTWGQAEDFKIYVPVGCKELYYKSWGMTETYFQEIPNNNVIDYVDEYSINHGPGTEIDGVTWAPVNCGYHATDFKYGKLYQWGRKYGQLSPLEKRGSPELISGPVPLSVGQSESNKDKFYYNTENPGNWLDYQDDKLWNNGNEEHPSKTEYDPCPEGWRVPTLSELKGLSQNRSEESVNSEGQTGYWYSGTTPYAPNAPKIFLPDTGDRFDQWGYSTGGHYWTSNTFAYLGDYLHSFSTEASIQSYFRSKGCAVRCVKE